MPPRRLKLAVALLLVTAVVAVYYPVLGNDFVNYDDDRYITNNLNVEAGLTPKSVAWAFGSFHGANWFPLTRLSWMLDAEIFGIEAWGFHLTNLLLHAANSVLLFLALLRLTGAPWRSAFVAAVFALHPLHVESVAWASERKDMLSGLFFMLTLLAYQAYARHGATRWRYRLVLVCVGLGLMSKPTLVTLPLLLLLLDEWPLRRLRRPESPLRWDPARLRRAVAEKLPLLGLSAVASLVTLSAQRRWGAVQPLEMLPLAERFENALVAYVTYLGKAFWPSNLAIFYPHPAGGISSGEAVGAAALLLAISVGLALAVRQRPALLIGWLWFLGMLVPMIGLVQVGAQARADRYMYLPLIGLTVSVAWGVADFVGPRRGARRAAAALAGVALMAMAVASAVQVRTWKNGILLFEQALLVTPNNDVALRNLGHALLGAGRLDEASIHLEASLRLAPGSATGHALLAAVRVAQERPDEAIELYREALERDPERRPWHENLARLHADAGRYPQAIARYRRALELFPQAGILHVGIGFALFRAGKTNAAIVSYEKAVELRPGLGVAHLRLGQALEATGRGKEAIPHYRETLRRGHASPALLNNLAWLLITTPRDPRKDSEEAIGLAERAAEATERGNPTILDTLARAYAAAGRYDDAARTASTALRLAEQQKRSSLAAEIRGRLPAYATGRAPE